MLCDICKKNEASIHIKEIIGGDEKALNLCAECASEHEKTAGIKFGAFNLAEMLYNLGKLGVEMAPGSAAPPVPADDPASPIQGPVCGHCGWTLGRLRDSGGRLGCPHCYETFRHLIHEALENVQRGTLHIGKRPDGSPADDRAVVRAELGKRRRELETLVHCENYEQAAQVRDRIRELEAKLNGDQTVAPEA